MSIAATLSTERFEGHPLPPTCRRKSAYADVSATAGYGDKISTFDKAKCADLSGSFFRGHGQDDADARKGIKMARSPATAKKSETFVALLRGINVGGKNMLPMKDLARMFEKAGCSDVKNYIQSGNIVFKAEAKIAENISDIIVKEIDRRFEIHVPVVVRTAKELHAVAKSNPFLKMGVDENRLHVIFLKDRPNAKQAQLLDPNRSPGDSFVVSGGEIFLSITSAATTKLNNAYRDSKLATVSTGRN